MSFSIYLTTFHNGVESYFPRKIVEDAFAEYVIVCDGRWSQLLYPDGARCDVTMEKDDMISGFGVNRPPANRAFWGAIMDLLISLPAALYWTGHGCVVANSTMSTQLPPEMVEALGEPIIVTRIEQIWEAIKSG